MTDQRVRREFEPERLAVVDMTPEALASFLHLPNGAYVDRIDTDERLGVLRLRIRGAGWLVEPGSIIPRAHAIVRKSFDADGACTSTTVDWVFPNEESK